MVSKDGNLLKPDAQIVIPKDIVNEYMIFMDETAKEVQQSQKGFANAMIKNFGSVYNFESDWFKISHARHYINEPLVIKAKCPCLEVPAYRFEAPLEEIKFDHELTLSIQKDRSCACDEKLGDLMVEKSEERNTESKPEVTSPPKSKLPRVKKGTRGKVNNSKKTVSNRKSGRLSATKSTPSLIPQKKMLTRSGKALSGNLGAASNAKSNDQHIDGPEDCDNYQKFVVDRPHSSTVGEKSPRNVYVTEIKFEQYVKYQNERDSKLEAKLEARLTKFENMLIKTLKLQQNDPEKQEENPKLPVSLTVPSLVDIIKKAHSSLYSFRTMAESSPESLLVPFRPGHSESSILILDEYEQIEPAEIGKTTTPLSHEDINIVVNSPIATENGSNSSQQKTDDSSNEKNMTAQVPIQPQIPQIQRKKTDQATQTIVCENDDCNSFARNELADAGTQTTDTAVMMSDAASQTVILNQLSDATTQSVDGEICNNCNLFVRDEVKKLHREYKEAKLVAGCMYSRFRCKMDKESEFLKAQLDHGLQTMSGQINSRIDSLRVEMDEIMEALCELFNNGEDLLEQQFPEF